MSSTDFFYCRVSTPEQAGEGKFVLDRYRDQGIRFGVPEENIYWDKESGGSKDRHYFGLLCQRLKDEPAERLITPHHSRLHRSLEIWVVLRSLLLQEGIDLIDLSKGEQPVDLQSPDGMFMSTIDAAIAEKERNERSKTARDGHLFRRSQGRANAAPFGYRLDKGLIVPNMLQYHDSGLTYWEAAQLIVSLYFEERSLDRTLRRMPKEWQGYKAHRDHPRSSRGLKDWLTNVALRGHTLYFGSRRHKNELPHQMKQLVPNTHTPLLTAEQVAIIEKSIKYPNTKQNPLHPLSRLVYCGECGGKMGKQRSAPTHEYFKCYAAYPRAGREATCTHRMPSYPRGQYHLNPYRVENLERYLVDALVSRADEIARDGAEQKGPATSPNAVKIAQLQTQLEALDPEDPDLKSAIASKKQKIAALRLGSDGFAVSDSRLLAELQEALADPEFWLQSEPGERGTVYRELVDRVTVSEGGLVEVTFRF